MSAVMYGQDITTNLTPAYVASRMPVRCLLRGPKSWKSLGWRWDSKEKGPELPSRTTVTSHNQVGSMGPEISVSLDTVKST